MILVWTRHRWESIFFLYLIVMFRPTVIDREQDRPTRWIKEAVHICEEGQQAMNQDKGNYQLSHFYNHFLDATADCRIKTRKNWVPAASDEDLVMRSKCRIKVKKFWLLTCIDTPTKRIYFSTIYTYFYPAIGSFYPAPESLTVTSRHGTC